MGAYGNPYAQPQKPNKGSSFGSLGDAIGHWINQQNKPTANTVGNAHANGNRPMFGPPVPGGRVDLPYNAAAFRVTPTSGHPTSAHPWRDAQKAAGTWRKNTRHSANKGNANGIAPSRSMPSAGNRVSNAGRSMTHGSGLGGGGRAASGGSQAGVLGPTRATQNAGGTRKKPKPGISLAQQIVNAQVAAAQGGINDINMQLASNNQLGGMYTTGIQQGIQQQINKNLQQTGMMNGLGVLGGMATHGQQLNAQDAFAANGMGGSAPSVNAQNMYAQGVSMPQAVANAHDVTNLYAGALQGQAQNDFFNRALAGVGAQNQAWQLGQTGDANRLKASLSLQAQQARAQKPIIENQLRRQAAADGLAQAAGLSKVQSAQFNQRLAGANYKLSAQRLALDTQKAMSQNRFATANMALKVQKARLSQYKTLNPALTASQLHMVDSVMNGTLKQYASTNNKKTGQKQSQYKMIGGAGSWADAYARLSPIIGSHAADQMASSRFVRPDSTTAQLAAGATGAVNAVTGAFG